MARQVALLLDGGFVTKKLKVHCGRFPTAADVMALTQRIMGHDRLRDLELFRIFFYDAPPLRGQSVNPVDRSIYDFDGHITHKRNQELQDTLSRQPDLALRRGELQMVGWSLRRRAVKELRTAPRALAARDFAPDIKQKGVDLRIGLDVASLSVKRVVDVIVLVTADSDLVPAMKFARREGLKVYLDPLGHGISTALHAHEDFVLTGSVGPARPA